MLNYWKSDAQLLEERCSGHLRRAFAHHRRVRFAICIFSLIATAALAFGQAVPEGLLPPVETTAVKGLPSPPAGVSTVMGGEIEKVDPVRDQLALKVPGGHRVKILFDERTQVFQDGKRISVLDLRPEDHASIETNLDGTAIFALRIHMLTKVPDGQIDGQVMSYNTASGELRLQPTNSNKPVTLIAVDGTPIERVGQNQFTEQSRGIADLVQGSLVELTFRSGGRGPGRVTHIDVLAIPGTEFVFQGKVTSLDLVAGRMTIAGGSDHPMDIAFDPSQFEVSHLLHQGSTVEVKARFDGKRYTATSISIE